MHKLLLCLAMILAMAPLSQAQEPEAVDEDTSLKSREALAHAVHFLLARTDKHLHGYVIQPGIVPTYKMVDRNYRAETYTAKIPVYEYKYVDVVKAVGSGSERRMVKTKERRVAGVKEYHEEERTRLIADPNGEIVRKVRVPVYSTQDLNKGVGIPNGLLGYNAKAMHTMLMLGVPVDTPELRRLKGALETHILNFGIPDATFDVAWLTAAFCRWPEQSDELEMIRAALLRKLLGGQVNDARLPGMWGPVSLDYEVAAATMKHQLSLYGDMAELKKALAAAKAKGRDRDVAKIEGQIVEAEHAIADANAAAMRVSWVAENFLGDYRKAVVLQPPHEGGGRSPDFNDTVYPVRPGSPMMDLLSENTTDLECTMWALFALAEADAMDMLPARIDRPEVGGTRFRPLDTQEATKLAFNAVVAAYSKKNKGWTMGHQYVGVKKKYFSDYEHIPERGDADLANPATPMADLAAYQCLVSLDRIRDLEDYSRTAGPMLEAVEDSVGQSADLLNATLKNLGKVTPGSRSGYTYVTAMSGFQYRVGGLELVRPEIYETLSSWLLKAQQPEGNWYTGKTTTIMDPPSRRALLDARWAVANAKLPAAKQRKSNPRSYSFALTGAEIPTIEYMNYLMDGVWPAIAVYWNAEGLNPRPAVLGRSLQRLNRSGMHVSYVSATSWPPPGMTDVPAAVVLSGTKAISDAQAKGLEPLFSYVRAGGLLIVEAPATEEGTAMARSLMSALSPALPNMTFGDVPDDNYLLIELEKRPPVKAFLAEDGAVAVLFVMLSDKTSGYELKPSAASVIVSTALKARLAPLLLDPQYLLLDGDGLAFDFTPKPEDDVGEDATGQEADE